MVRRLLAAALVGVVAGLPGASLVMDSQEVLLLQLLLLVGAVVVECLARVKHLVAILEALVDNLLRLVA